MRTRHALGIALGSTALLSSVFAFADTATPTSEIPQSSAAQVTMVASGAKLGRVDGEMRLRYPGTEQTTVAISNNHLVLITMEAVQEPGRGPVQCSCSSYELRADGPPREVVSMKRLTEYSNGERTCNHPKAAADNKGNVVWGYGSDYNSNRPNTYVGILSNKCETLAAPTMVSIPRDANDGAFDIDYNAEDDSFVGGYYSDGGDPTTGFPAPGGDYSVAMGLKVTPGALLPTIERTWITPVVTPTNIGRPTVVSAGPGRALFCAPKGPNRPSDSIECALLDTTNGKEVWKSEILKGDRNKRMMYNQPSIAKVGPDQFALLALETNGMGQGTNIKGTNISHLVMLQRNGDSMVQSGLIDNVAQHSTHASICTGPYGEQGASSVAVFNAAPTGIGRASMSMVGWDNNTRQFAYDPAKDQWPVSWYGDSGHLSNWYGRNPMRQGRDYLRCIGGVANPGYHVPNGFMPDVKTFFAATVSGRRPGDYKNSLFLSLVPGQMDKKPTPQNPQIAGEKPVLDPNASTSSDNGGSADSGCGCATPGTSNLGNGAALAALAAVGVVVSRRRRRQ